MTNRRFGDAAGIVSLNGFALGDRKAKKKFTQQPKRWRNTLNQIFNGVR